jgi:hypothetical protein
MVLNHQPKEMDGAEEMVGADPMSAWASEIVAPKRKPRVFRQVVAKKIDDIWALDLANMSDLKDDNNGFTQMLVVVDVFSRHAWCAPLKNKSADATWKALEPLLLKYKPRCLWTDQGSEFYNKTWTSKLKALKIHLYSAFTGESKVSIAERFIRTLKTKLWFYFFSHNTRKWIDVLPEVVATYNATKHRTLKMTPDDARLPKNKLRVLETHRPLVIGTPKYKIGDWVRISRTKDTFEKGFYPNWSFEVFQVVGVRPVAPVLYAVKDYDGKNVDGWFYEPELQAVADPHYFPVEEVLKQRRTYKGQKQALTKLIGYKEPRWLPLDALGQLAGK